MGETAKPQNPAPDALYDQLKAQATTDSIDAAKVRLGGDSASILARYGQRLALTTGGSPGAMTPPAAAA